VRLLLQVQRNYELFVRKQVDDDGNAVLNKGDDVRFLIARKGDHLITPFQCPVCHF